MTYDDAVAFWYARINFEVRSAEPNDLKLERMRALLRLLGDPHDRLRIVHITGTKGKGSTAAMIAAVARASGYRVGLFTSPHLVHVEERFQVDGESIGQIEFSALMAEVAPAVLQLEAGPFPPPTFFEISTALGFLHFVRRRVEFAVIEVGLGGRFDSTNVCRPLVSVITSIGLDHMAQLGSTEEAIAFQKAGIIKRAIPVVSGVTQPASREVVERIAHDLGSPLVQLGRDFDCEYEASRNRVRLTTSGCHYDLGLLGEHQAANAAVAVAALERLRDSGMSLPETSVAKGLRDVRWPARIERLSAAPAVVLDMAHNVPSVRALVTTLRHSVPVSGKKVVVFAVSTDKQYPEMLAILAEHFDEFHLTKYGTNPRCVPPEKLAEILGKAHPNRPFTIHATAAAAWNAARSAAGPDDLVCVTGSVFLAGELRTAMTQHAARA